LNGNVSLKARSAIEAARQALLEALQATVKPHQIEMILWETAAKVEYASATLSISHGFEDYDPLVGKRIPRAESLRAAFETCLSMLSKALQGFDTDMRDSYANLRYVVALLRTLSPKLAW